MPAHPSCWVSLEEVRHALSGFWHAAAALSDESIFLKHTGFTQAQSTMSDRALALLRCPANDTSLGYGARLHTHPTALTLDDKSSSSTRYADLPYAPPVLFYVGT